jgi:kumamolisin
MMGRTVPLAGSDRAVPIGATYVGEVDPDERIVITVYLKRRTPDLYQPGSAGDLARLSKPVTRRALSVERRRTHGRAANRIRKLAARFGVTLCGFDLSQRIVVLEATARQMTEILGATLRIYDDGHCRFRARVGPLVVPKGIAPWTRAILGFDQRPIVRPVPRLRPQVGAALGAGMWPTEVAALYGIPLDHDVSKICVGGGGYLATDLAKALAAMGREPPTIIDQSVATPTTASGAAPASGSVSAGGAAPANGNHFGGGSVADEEIALDLQILASLLPKARIVVYFAGNTIQSLVGAINQAIFDNVNRPQVLSVSWGSAEMFWSPSARDAMQAVLADAQRLKVTVLFAAGDELATGGLDDGKAHVWFPSSSPYALGCGGTQPANGGTGPGEEVVWNDGMSGTGGGVSDFYPVPAYQSALALPPSVNDGKIRRGVPDVAAAAAATPGYRIVLNGSEMVKDGTSAATPLWAGLIAIANAARGEPVGFANSALYSNPAAFRQIDHGDNRVGGKGYQAGPGWNACTGLGVPNGADIVAALAAIPVA